MLRIKPWVLIQMAIINLGPNFTVYRFIPQVMRLVDDVRTLGYHLEQRKRSSYCCNFMVVFLCLHFCTLSGIIL